MYEIGPFRLDPKAEVLTRDGHALPLGSRAVAVLTVLVEHAGEHVPKARIMDAAWRNVVVEESNLSVQISAIRRAFAAVEGGEHWIETLARRGYRFVGPVRALGAPESGAGAAPRASGTAATQFIGREREIGRAKRLLANVRLLTITGIGGIGKTRLAQRIAEETAARYRDGAWFVDLAPVNDPARVASAIGQVLRVREPKAGSFARALAHELRGAQMLLVLDNCEHVVEECARVAETLLAGVGEITLLATSREPLAIPGEQTLVLAPLALPREDDDLPGIEASEAVRLFMDRARRQQPDFDITPDRARAIARLCVRLDGIPLALELAAARIRSLTVEQIGARLDDRFRLLTNGTRTALQRHRTLRAAFDWSYDLLSQTERSVLRRLAVFAGGFTLEAACAVTSDESVDDYAVTDVIHQLVSRSLVVAEDERRRYRLLETTRAYAREQLAESGEEARLRERHAAYFREFFERAADAWLALDDAAWCSTYEVELDNLRGALAASAGDAALGLAGASGPLWSALALTVEGASWLERASEDATPASPAIDQARIWMWLGMLHDASPARAVEAYERSIAIYRTLDDSLWLAHALMRSARVLAEVGRIGEARQALDEAYPALRAAGLPRALGLHCEYVGFVELMQGNPAAARRLKEEALALYRAIGAESLALDALGNLADVVWALGDLDAAVRAFRETIALLRKSPLARKRSLGFTLANFAGALIERGDLDEALVAGREGLPHLRDGGYAWIFMDHFAARAALARDPARAARLGGFAEHAYAAKEATRQPNEARARERWESAVRAAFDPATIARLHDEGAALTEAEACALALEAPPAVRSPAGAPAEPAARARGGSTRLAVSPGMR